MAHLINSNRSAVATPLAEVEAGRHTVIAAATMALLLPIHTDRNSHPTDSSRHQLMGLINRPRERILHSSNGTPSMLSSTPLNIILLKGRLCRRTTTQTTLRSCIISNSNSSTVRGNSRMDSNHMLHPHSRNITNHPTKLLRPNNNPPPSNGRLSLHRSKATASTRLAHAVGVGVDITTEVESHR